MRLATRGRQFALEARRNSEFVVVAKPFLTVASVVSARVRRLTGQFARRVRKRDERTCGVCGVQGDLNDPPFPTCHCGEWRYCSPEACQAQDWAAAHAEECASGYLHLGAAAASGQWQQLQ